MVTMPNLLFVTINGKFAICAKSEGGSPGIYRPSRWVYCKTTAEPRREIADVIGEISTTPSAERTDDEGNGGRPKLQTVEEVEEGGSTPIWSVLKKRAATTRK